MSGGGAERFGVWQSVVALCVAAFAACKPPWDDAFDRDEVADPPMAIEGWMQSDGAPSIQLPELGTTTPGDRTLWLFGDTMTYNNASGVLHDLTTGDLYVSDFAPRNSIALHDTAGGGPPERVVFIARDGTDAVLKEMDQIPFPSNAESSVRSFLSSSEPTLPEPDVWRWPGDGVFAGGEVYTFWHERAQDLDSGEDCRPVTMGLGGPHKQFVVTIDNPEAPVLDWTYNGGDALPDNAVELVDAAGVSPYRNAQVQWGNGILLEGSTTYIYGFTQSSSGCDAGPVDYVLARVANPNFIPNYRRWEFLRNDCPGQACTPPCWCAVTPAVPGDLFVIATGATPEFSIDRITLNNTTAYLLVQGDPAFVSTNIHLRISDSREAFPAIADGPPDVHSISIPTNDFVAEAARQWFVNLGPAVQQRLGQLLLAGDQEVGARAVKAHGHLEVDPLFPQFLLVSYYMTAIWPHELATPGFVTVNNDQCGLETTEAGCNSAEGTFGSCRWDATFHFSGSTGTCLDDACTQLFTGDPTGCRQFDQCWNNPGSFGRCESRPKSGRTRFLPVNLASVAPWCDAAIQNCVNEPQ